MPKFRSPDLHGAGNSREYFVQINQFITTRWAEAQQRYKIIIDDPELVAREMLEGIRGARIPQGAQRCVLLQLGLKIDRVPEARSSPRMRTCAT
jgi:hypothetical protein